MNILIVTQYFWPENFLINDLVLGLFERGYQVTVITGIPNYPEGRFFRGYGLFKKMRQNYHGVKVFRVPLVPRGRGGGLRLALNYFSFALFASLLGPIILRTKCDLIFVYEPSPITVGFPALVLKKIKSAPIIFWVQDLWPESISATKAVTSKRILKIIEMMVRFIYRRCDRILVQSRAFFAPIERLGVDSELITYFPNSTDQLYKSETLNSEATECNEIPDGFRVMFAGNIGVAQDFGTILGAAEILKDYSDIYWIIIGDGRMRSWVESQLKERGLMNSVLLLGRHSAKAMPRYYSLADVLLVTLKKDPILSLTIPSKVQSYLAYAKPIVAAIDGEGARVIKESGAGLICPAEDPASLAKAVLSLYGKSHDQLRLMGELGRRYFEKNFDRDTLLNQLDTMMKEFVSY